MPRRSYVFGALALSSAAVAVGTSLAIGVRGDRRPAQREYLAHVSSICRRYARQIARVGAPADAAAYGEVESTVGRVLPLLRKQAAAMRTVQPPAALRARLERLFRVDGRSVAELEATLAAARRRDARGVGTALFAFTAASQRVHALAVAIGISCEVT